MKFAYFLLAFLALFTIAFGAGEIGCNNSQDLDVFVREKDTMHGKLDKCATRCLAATACSRACLVRELGLTQECATCFATDMLCVTEHCLAPCTASHTSDECINCNEEKCMPDTVACAHVPREVIPR